MVEEVRRQLLEYLKQNFAPRWSSYLGPVVASVALFVYFGVKTGAWQVLSPVLIVCVITFGSAVARSVSNYNQMRRAVELGVPVSAAIVMANEVLWKPGLASAPALALFTFDELANANESLTQLAENMFQLKCTKQTGDLATVAQMVTDERYQPNRRVLLPLTFTGGARVYAGDLFVIRSWLRDHYLNRRALSCFAEMGETGRLQMVPDWLLDSVASQEGLELSGESEQRKIGFRQN